MDVSSQAGSRPTPEDANLLARLDRIPITPTIWRIMLLLVLAWITESFDIGIIGPVVLALKKIWYLSPSDMGLLGTSSTMGIVIGLAVAGPVADQFGRRKVLLWGVTWFALFTLLTPLIENLRWIAAMRFIAGLGEGAVFPIPYLMISEFVNAKKRGLVVGIMVALLTGSYIVPSLAGAWAFSHFSAESSWRILFLVGGLPLLIVPILAFGLPESPRWLLQRGKVEEVRKIVERLEAEAGLENDEASRDAATSAVSRNLPSRISASECWLLFKPPYLLRSVISWGMYTSALLMFYVPMVYGPTIFAQKGLDFGNATLFTGVMMVLAAVGGLLQGQLADIFGRKPIMLAYSLLAAAGFALLAYVGQLATIAAAGVLAAFFGIGIFPILKLYIAEQYPTRLRGAGTGIGEATSRFLGGVLATYYVAYILAYGGVAAVFAFVAVMAVIFVIPMLLWGRETAGISVEQAGDEADRKTPLRRYQPADAAIATSRPEG